MDATHILIIMQAGANLFIGTIKGQMHGAMVGPKLLNTWHEWPNKMHEIHDRIPNPSRKGMALKH